MVRRKKQKQEEDKNESTPVVHGDAKRSVAAVFLLALAILFVLGFLSDAKIVDAGVLGKFLSSMAGLMFGVGKYISPIVLIIASIILLFRKETSFYVSKLLGITLAFTSFLGLVHILAYDPENILSVAKKGDGGGFVGYVLSFLLLKLTGKVGGAVILVALLLIGIIVTFNFSLVAFIQKFIHKELNKDENEEESGTDDEEDETDIIEDPVVIDRKEDEKADEEQIEFVKDPNEEESKISESVLQKAAAWVPKNLRKKEKQKKQAALDWVLPDVDLLETYTGKAQGGDVKNNVKIIQDTLKHFGIDVEPGEIKTGPTVTQYSFRPAVGVKLTRITSLSQDLALALAAHPIRIEAPIPGKSMIGIEVPNKVPAMVRLVELLQSSEFENRQSNLLLALGKDVNGDFIFGDLKKMPHLLIAGSTNSGKSVCVNSILMSMLFQNSPQDLRLILVDPKRVELTLYNGVPHLLSDVIVENGKVLSALKWAIGEMERRYKKLQSVGSRDIASYNQKAENGEMRVYRDEENEEHEELIEKLPYIVIVIDELADLMTSHGKEVEGAVIRLAQMSRAVGIHLILSTQKPIVTVITSLIKSNIPTRIAFKVPALMDSRTILDASGAEKLLGNGDMLFSSAASQGLRRLQGVYVSENEVKRVVEYISKQKYEKMEEGLEDDIVTTENEHEHKGNKNGEVKTTYSNEKIDFASIAESSDQHEDSRFEEAKNVVIQAGKASSSLLQRRLGIGYSRAARLVDMLEDQGIIGQADGAKPREVLVGQSDQPVYADPTLDQISRDKWQM